MRTSEVLEGIIRTQPELIQLRDSFEEDTRSQFEEYLDILFDHHDTLYGPDAPSDREQIQLEEFCEKGQSLAKRYLNHPRWHTPWLTHYILVDVLESQLIYLQWMSKWGVYPAWSLRQRLSSPYKSFVPTLISLCICALWLGLEVWLVTEERTILAAALGAWMLYFYLIKRPWLWWSRWKKRQHVARLAQLLMLPVQEIKSNAYDPEIVRRRLQASELPAASLAFQLLILHSRCESP